jgi:molybdate transport system substrate-binding protein
MSASPIVCNRGASRASRIRPPGFWKHQRPAPVEARQAHTGRWEKRIVMVLFKHLLATACMASVALCNLPTKAADLLVFSDGPLQSALGGIVDAFQNNTGHKVQVLFGTAPALRAKLKAGEQPDVLITLAAEIDEMAKHDELAATVREVARIKLALAVRHGAPKPDISTLNALKQTLLQADSIIYNSLASGLLFAKQLERIGIAEQVKSKVVVIKGNTQLAELAERKGKDVAAAQLTQLLASKNVQLVDVLPQEAQAETIYSAGALSTSKSLPAARAFVTHLAGTQATAAFQAAGAR